MKYYCEDSQQVLQELNSQKSGLTEKEAAERLVRESSQDNGWFYTIEFLLRAERDGMKIYDMPVEWQEDYNTTVKVWKTIKNYLIQMYHLKKAFRQEDKLRK